MRELRKLAKETTFHYCDISCKMFSDLKLYQILLTDVFFYY